MVATHTPAGVSLEVLQTRLIPGLVLISPPLLSLWLLDSTIFSSFSLALLAIALVALVFGELVDQVRSGLFRTPLLFTHHISAATGHISHLPTWHRYLIRIDGLLPDKFGIVEELPKESALEERLQFDLQIHMEEVFGLDPESALPRDFYDALILYIDEGLSARTQRYHNACIFSQNLKITTGIACLFLMYYIGLSYPDPDFWIYVGAIVILLVLTFMVTRFLVASPHVYLEMLVKEFYMKQIVG